MERHSARHTCEGHEHRRPVIAHSWQVAGSGILTFVAVALLLGLWTDRTTAAAKVVAMAGLAGITAMIFDIFVL